MNEPTLKEVTITITDGEIDIQPLWNGVDRPFTFGWMLKDKPSNRKLAERLKKAILAGVILTHPSIQTDIYKKTYVSHNVTVHGRRLNSDLKRLGF